MRSTRGLLEPEISDDRQEIAQVKTEDSVLRTSLTLDKMSGHL